MLKYESWEFAMSSTINKLINIKKDYENPKNKAKMLLGNGSERPLVVLERWLAGIDDWENAKNKVSFLQDTIANAYGGGEGYNKFYGTETTKNPYKSLADCIRQWLYESTYGRRSTCIFANNRTMWIDLLSSLHATYNIFGGSAGQEPTFEEFLEKYKAFLGSINNSRLISFYSRNIADICAAITVFGHKNAKYYFEIRNKLTEVYKSAYSEKNLISTDSLTASIVKIISVNSSHGFNDHAIQADLARKIKESPCNFEVEHHYCVILKLLQMINAVLEEKEGTKGYPSEEKRTLFRSMIKEFELYTSEGRYATKKENLRNLRNDIKDYLSAQNKDAAFLFHGAYKSNMYGQYNWEVKTAMTIDEKKQEIISVLRLIYASEKADLLIFKNKSKKDVLETINMELIDIGLLDFPIEPKNIYEKSKADYLFVDIL